MSYLNKFSISFCWTSLSITMGCWQGLAFNNLLKYGLHAESTTLWAVKEQPSQAKVTSTKSSSSRRCRNEDSILEWKSFHRSAYCCSGEVSPPIGQIKGAISTPMIVPFNYTTGMCSHAMCDLTLMLSCLHLNTFCIVLFEVDGFRDLYDEFCDVEFLSVSLLVFWLHFDT